jgi:hypothetical protein
VRVRLRRPHGEPPTANFAGVRAPDGQALGTEIHQCAIVLQLERRDEITPRNGQPDAQRFASSPATIAVLPVGSQEDTVVGAGTLHLGGGAQHIARMTKVLEPRCLRGGIQGLCMLDAPLDLERFGEAFDAVYRGRPNGFTRHAKFSRFMAKRHPSAASRT